MLRSRPWVAGRKSSLACIRPEGTEMMNWEPALAGAKERWRDLHEATGLTEDVIEQGGGQLHRISGTSADYRCDPGNWPKILYRDRPAGKALVLIHGLTDSPAFVEAIGVEFAGRGDGFTVLMPLLPGHGRKNPHEEMRTCTYQQWRHAVDDAVAIASTLADQVSIGGFSTGGALSFDKVLRDWETVSGKIYLFSAALNLSNVDKLFLGTHLASVVEDIKTGKTGNDGLGGDPCKYSRMYNSAAHELELLIELQTASRDRNEKEPFSAFRDVHRVFVDAVDINHLVGFRPLATRLTPAQRFIIPRQKGIEHSQLFSRKIEFMNPFADMKPPPKANPCFGSMMKQIFAFVDKK